VATSGVGTGLSAEAFYAVAIASSGVEPTARPMRARQRNTCALSRLHCHDGDGGDQRRASLQQIGRPGPSCTAFQLVDAARFRAECSGSCGRAAGRR